MCMRKDDASTMALVRLLDAAGVGVRYRDDGAACSYHWCNQNSEVHITTGVMGQKKAVHSKRTKTCSTNAIVAGECLWR